MKIELTVTGAFCNTWPDLTIQQNDNVVFCNAIKNTTIISLTLDYAPFSVGMQNKNFGNNNVWDTLVDQDNNILADKLITVNEFLLDDVSILSLLPSIEYTDALSSASKFITDCTIRYNGFWKFNISSNAYDYIIDIKNSMNHNIKKEVNYQSDVSNIGNYDDHYAIMQKIKSALNI